MTIYVLQTKRGTETAKVSGTDIFLWMEERDIKVFNYTDFFQKELDKTLIKKDDIVVVHTTIPEESKYDDRFKSMKCKKIFRTMDGYNTDGIPMKKALEKVDRLEIQNLCYCHTNRNIEDFLKKTNYNYFYIPHCIDFSNKRISPEKKYNLSISGHMSHEVYPTRTRIFNYFSKVKTGNSLSIVYLPHPGYETRNASHNIIGEKYIDFLSESELSVTCKAGWRDAFVAKYIEIGKAGSLPVGDLPDAMDKRLKDLIVNIDDSMDNNMMIEKIISQIENKKELKQKTAEYQNLCEKIYDKNIVIPMFIKGCLDL